MYLLADEVDPELQNEIALNGGGLQASYDLTAQWQGPVTLSILHLLCYLSQSNMLVKNNARQGGLLPLLLSVIKCCSMLPTMDSPSSPESSAVYAWTPTAVLAAKALACLVHSCHESQDEVADQGGVEMIVSLMASTIDSAANTHRSMMAKANAEITQPPLPSLSDQHHETQQHMHRLHATIQRQQQELVLFALSSRPPLPPSPSLLQHIVEYVTKTPAPIELSAQWIHGNTRGCQSYCNSGDRKRKKEEREEREGGREKRQGEREERERETERER